MKKIFLLLSFTFLFISLSAQNGKYLGPFKIKKVDLMLGKDSDRIDNFDPSYFTDQLESNDEFAIDQVNFQNQDLITATCENPHFRFGLTLEIPNMERLEWRNAINWMPNRIDEITYYEDNSDAYFEEFGNLDDYRSTYLFLNHSQSEIALESAVLYKIVDKNKFKVYGGAGSNAGIAYNNNISVYGSNIGQIEGVDLRNEEELNSDPLDHDFYFYSNNDQASPNQFNHRLFAQAGASVILWKRLELGVDFRRGIGYRTAQNLPAQFTKLISTGLSARFILK